MAIRFLPFISGRQNWNPEQSPIAVTAFGTLLADLLFRGSTTIKDAVFHFNSH
jgi:hypothetical protein